MQSPGRRALPRPRGCEVCGRVERVTAAELFRAGVESVDEMMRCFGCGAIVCQEHDTAGIAALRATGDTAHMREAHWAEHSPRERAALRQALAEQIRAAFTSVQAGKHRAKMPGTARLH